MAVSNGCAESCTGWWTLPGAAAILRYALGVQQRVNASWDEEMSQPVWQPWSHLMTLFSAEQAGMPEAHRALLLQLVLASPPPCQVTQQVCLWQCPLNRPSSIVIAEAGPGFARTCKDEMAVYGQEPN